MKRKGQSLGEYVVILAFVALLASLAVINLGKSIKDMYKTIGGSLVRTLVQQNEPVTVPTPPPTPDPCNNGNGNGHGYGRCK